ncbi:Elongation of very long chain fatty acids protein 6 [Armadillidium vulgare]|nr:Elongation of very long chain fatty acids protein 6 [Armadillidium vulgare]
MDNRVGGFWNWMFTLSKVPELGDTIFIVLRKQPLIFLHWYHHVTVLLYAWYSYPDYIATARWFICMNYLVHSAMYTYYALKALKFRVPRWIAMGITSAQLAQMIMGTAVNIWAYQVKQAGNECHVSYENINLSLLMYTSYFVLFARFFRRAYMKKAAKIENKGMKKTDSATSLDFDKRKGTKLE